jgi:4-hydroxy-tetrahydrodipicolinate synthase
MTTLSPAKQAAFEKVTGLWIAIPTPFTADGAVDEPALKSAVEYYIEGLGVDGIFCGGIMGEFWALTLEERFLVHQLVVDAASGRVPIMPHIGHHVYADSAALSRHAEQIGADFVIALNPYFPIRPSDDLVRNWYRRLAGESSVPLFLFNTAYSGYSISPELIDELADLDTVCGIKNPKPAEQVAALHARVGDRIVVCDAAEEQWLGLHLDHGFQALMSTPALAMFQTPERKPIVDYTRAADEGRLDEAWEIHASLEGEREAFEKWMRQPWLAQGSGAIPIAQLKTWLELMGLPQGPVRPPLVPLSDREREELAADLDRLGLLDSI